MAHTEVRPPNVARTEARPPVSQPARTEVCPPNAARTAARPPVSQPAHTEVRPPNAARTEPRPPMHHLFQMQCWDTQLRTGESYAQKWEYVRNNPVRKGLCQVPEDWPYQGELNVLAWHD